ncbi:MAG TPA: hypothetical protein VGS58_14865 [Candidatus Sulfopaludibacter sp.]|nr:hypothetical protein [Candidatus Sulfopaludibacter sp.]
MKTLLIPTILLLGSCCLAAAATRTYVSSGGTDSPNVTCSRTAPCATIQYALGFTDSGGEIDVMDTGDYSGGSKITVTQPVTIDGGAVLATTAEIDVNTAGLVILRNLSIASGAIGVANESTAWLRLEHVAISGAGLLFGVECPAGSCALSDVRIRNAHNSGVGAAVLANGGKVSLTNCILTDSDVGVATPENGLAQVDSTTIQFNTIGVSTNGNQTGQPAGAVRLSNSAITDNGIGLQVAGGSIVSFGNNRIFGNSTNGNPTLVTTNR